MSINQVNISGNLTRNAELRQTNNGTPILDFCVAINDHVKNPQTQEWEDRPNFVGCTMFGSRANALAPYFIKGTKVFIGGKLRYDQWEKDGEKHSRLSVVVTDVDFYKRTNDNNIEQPDTTYQDLLAKEEIIF